MEKTRGGRPVVPTPRQMLDDAVKVWIGGELWVRIFPDQWTSGGGVRKDHGWICSVAIDRGFEIDTSHPDKSLGFFHIFPNFDICYVAGKLKEKSPEKASKLMETQSRELLHRLANELVSSREMLRSAGERAHDSEKSLVKAVEFVKRCGLMRGKSFALASGKLFVLCDGSVEVSSIPVV